MCCVCVYVLATAYFSRQDLEATLHSFAWVVDMLGLAKIEVLGEPSLFLGALPAAPRKLGQPPSRLSTRAPLLTATDWSSDVPLLVLAESRHGMATASRPRPAASSSSSAHAPSASSSSPSLPAQPPPSVLEKDWSAPHLHSCLVRRGQSIWSCLCHLRLMVLHGLGNGITVVLPRESVALFPRAALVAREVAFWAVLLEYLEVRLYMHIPAHLCQLFNALVILSSL
jgi:hypothetical protein